MAEIAGAGTLEAVYEAALHCLQATLGVERASMLLRDAEGRMRFVASSGLSEAYRRAVDGHSPWADDEPDPQTVLVEDIRAEPVLSGLLSALEAERIGALAFVPLRYGPALLGKFMLYYEAPHAFTADEVVIAEIVAGHVAFALEQRRIAAELEKRLAAEAEARRDAEREAALRLDGERRLRLALAAGQMGVWEWDFETGAVEWSEELERIHGLPPGNFGGTFEAVQQDVHPEDLDRMRARVERALAEPGGEYEIEYRIVPPDGSQRWVAARGRVLGDPGGRPRRMVGICRDITMRKRAEAGKAFLAEAGRVLATTLEPKSALRQLARLVVPYLGDWCSIYTADGPGPSTPVEVAHRDPAMVEMAWELVRRWPPRSASPGGVAGVIASGRSALIPEVTAEAIAAAAQDAEHAQHIERLGLRSLMTVPLKARGRVLGALSLGTAESRRTYGPEDLAAAEEIASWAAIALDNAALFAEAEEARGAAERARSQLQSLFEISGDLAASLDPGDALRRLADRIVETMADYCVTYSYDGTAIERQGLAHRLPAKVNLVQRLAELGEPRLDDAEGAGAVIRTGEAVLASDITEERVARSTQSAAHATAVLALAPRSAMIVPLRSRGRTLGAIAFATTADSERRYDAEDLRLATELAARAALLVDNARLYAEARAAVAARDDMIQLVSHDLRNPLQSISTAAALLQFDPPAERRARSLASITLATMQMNRLLQDLLDISQMDAGRFSVSPEWVEAKTLVDEAFTLFGQVAEEKSIRLVCRADEDATFVKADRARIMQVLTNLIGNALKFVPEGGTITVAAERQGSRVRFAVADTGIGLAPDQQPRVFDRFWRGEYNKERGAGLGLAVAKGIVEAHGGEIGVESRRGVGSTFYFLLDAVPLPVLSELAAETGPILVVDDDDDFREEVVDVLRGQGYAVIDARDGVEALAHLRSQRRPALVLLDMMMPVMDGWTLLETVKLDRRLEDVPLVLLTCLGEQQIGAPVESVAGYLEKPVRLGELLDVAARHCRPRTVLGAGRDAH